ncbi:hypothetical protein [Phenylobacterium sp.]|uniref:hypothetical protein n=1 Tax=Phenylobacterium sp. TaxID=1871053 RepID=UPI0028A0A344|nr:hypothetical protein [Phenylobacterium sp.]
MTDTPLPSETGNIATDDPLAPARLMAHAAGYGDNVALFILTLARQGRHWREGTT